MLLQTALVIFVLVQISGSASITDSDCKAPGVNPHPYDREQFLICANDQGKLLLTETVLCPKNYVYSVSEKTCVHGQQNQPASPPTNSRRTRSTAAGGCKTSGPYCEACDRLVICAIMGDNVLSAIANVSCSETDPKLSCSKGSCTTQPETTDICDGSDQAGAFRCLQPGFFPDPAKCSLFHFCGNDLSHSLGECDEKFDASLGICTNMESPTCKNIETPCSESNIAPLKLLEYTSYYRICIPVATKGRKPAFYQVSVAKCPEGQEFDNMDRACKITCAGKRGRYPDPDNCHSYFECPASSTANNPAVKKTCPDNQAFDKDRKLCLPEKMVKGCQRTRAVETSTSSDTTINQAITTKTNPGVGFQCRSSGIFPDDSDCHRYIICSLGRDGVNYSMRRRLCPWFTRFNPRGYCQLGFCWN